MEKSTGCILEVDNSKIIKSSQADDLEKTVSTVKFVELWRKVWYPYNAILKRLWSIYLIRNTIDLVILEKKRIYQERHRFKNRLHMVITLRIIWKSSKYGRRITHLLCLITVVQDRSNLMKISNMWDLQYHHGKTTRITTM